MNEKFIYPLLAILLAVISTNVSAVIIPENQTTPKDITFTWAGILHVENPSFDWEFVDDLGFPYIQTKEAFLAMERVATAKIALSGMEIEFFIVPKGAGKETNRINSVSASLIGMPSVSGLKADKRVYYTKKIDSTVSKNQVAIIINGSSIQNQPTPITATGLTPSTDIGFPVYIRLEGLIIEDDYMIGEYFRLPVPIVFSVQVISK